MNLVTLPVLDQITLSVVFSFRNEEHSLPLLIPRVRKVCSKLGLKEFELVFVNDCSTDQSLNILLREQALGGDVVVVNTSRRFGVSECVMAGLQETKGDYVVYMDADLQDPPELIPQMIQMALREKADVVYTTRLSRQGETWVKLRITKFGYWILRNFSSIEVPADSGDFKLLSRRVVRELLLLKEHKPFMRGLVTWVGFKQVQIFYDREPRAAGVSQFPIFSRRVIYNFLDSAMISFSDAPLKASLGVGLLVIIGSVFMLIYIFALKLIGWALPGWSAVMATMLVLGGMQLFMVGVLGLYIHAIYLQVKGRPLYIVERVDRPASTEKTKIFQDVNSQS